MSINKMRFKVKNIYERAKSFIDYCQKENPDYNYSKILEIKGYRSKVEIICPIHGGFIQRVDHHLNGSKCPKCMGGAKKTVDYFIHQAKSVHGNKYDYSLVEYKNSSTSIKLICPIHGPFSIIPYHHLKGANCHACVNRTHYTTETFIKACQLIHNNKYNYSKTEYTKVKNEIVVICPKHGEFKTTAWEHKNGGGCSKCSHVVSKRETAWLNSLNIKGLQRQVRIKVEDKLYKVDGYDPQTNTIYEFNGSYHHGDPDYYDPMFISQMSKKTNHELYSKTIEKERKLRQNGYIVIVMWEADWIIAQGKKFPRKKLTSQKMLGWRQNQKRYYEMLDDDGMENYDWLINNTPIYTRT